LRGRIHAGIIGGGGKVIRARAMDVARSASSSCARG
jgi:hypothetical protein